jgi:DNA-binding NarL/FixJ family response regulator
VITTIVLADDHALIRTGLRTVIEGESDWAVVGEAADGREAVRLARLSVSRATPSPACFRGVSA